MRTSSAELLSDGLDRSTFEISAASSSGGSSTSGAQTLRVPSFDAQIIAATSRIAGRVNAANIKSSEIDHLLRERQLLLDKKFAGQASRRDLNRLAYVRWSLDRAEDAKYGQGLDNLENAVESYERLLADLESLTRELTSHKMRGRR